TPSTSCTHGFVDDTLAVETAGAAVHMLFAERASEIRCIQQRGGVGVQDDKIKIATVSSRLKCAGSDRQVDGRRGTEDAAEINATAPPCCINILASIHKECC